MKAEVIFTILFISSVVWTQVPIVSDLSNDLKACYSDNKSGVNKCLFNFWNDLRPILIAGVDNGPTLDPLIVGDVVLPETYTNIRGKLQFFDIVLKGFGEYVVKAASLNTDNMTMTVDFLIPHLNVECRYDFNATVLFVPVIGSGPFHAVFKDLEGIMTLHVERNEVGQLNLVETELDVVPASLKVNLAELFGGADISTVVHDLLHDNMELIYEDIRFNVGDEIANRGLHKVLKGLFQHLTPDIFH